MQPKIETNIPALPLLCCMIYHVTYDYEFLSQNVSYKEIMPMLSYYREFDGNSYFLFVRLQQWIPCHGMCNEMLPFCFEDIFCDCHEAIFLLRQARNTNICTIIGINHDTVCAGVVGTVIRHSTSCAGRRAATWAGQRVLCRIAVPTTTVQTI